MIYPKNFERKIGFDEIRTLLSAHCLSQLGRSRVDDITFSSDASQIGRWLDLTRDFRRLMEEEEDLPLTFFFDVRESVARLRLEGTYMDEPELFDLRRSLDTICRLHTILTREEDEKPLYPTLHELASETRTFPHVVKRIDQILDKYGKIKDSASVTLANIRIELMRTEGSVSRALNGILHAAQKEGLVEKDVTPTLRDGRLVIPLAPAMKRKIRGIVHDESASGKTVFIEPAEVVEANNRIRELEADERREIIRILKEFASLVRPHVKEITESYRFLAEVDFIQAKLRLANQIGGIEPVMKPEPHIDWIHAEHPLLKLSLARQDKKVVPLDLTLTRDRRILIISGPNAGGKSVCLKTTGLLQYMVQCGLSIPLSERSTVGIFESILIDIGDEQSIENDLSTYSSHLLNMKHMMRASRPTALLLIDEFGGGTEPQIGGALAEAMLGQFCRKGSWGIITTHYQNLKHFADSHPEVVNGAMLYDRHEMQALFQLEIGRPGSSFAVEIARKTGIPEEVIKEASDIVGRDYIQSDKYLQDIVRDKRYWENKRENIHRREKDMERAIGDFEQGVEEIERERKRILRKAQQQAEEILAETNRRIENTIREIREAQAEKERTREAREELAAFREEVRQLDADQPQQGTKGELKQKGLMSSEDLDRKIEQLRQRKERHQKHKEEKARKAGQAAEALRQAALKPKAASDAPVSVGSTVRVKGTPATGTVEKIQGKKATVVIGGMRSQVEIKKLEVMASAASPAPTSTTADKWKEKLGASRQSRMTRDTIDEHKSTFSHEIDLRGCRGDEALDKVMHFLDDAILMGVSQVKILHGTGNGILRQLIRQYLRTVPNVNSFRDEDIRFGGHGITVVEL